MAPGAPGAPGPQGWANQSAAKNVYSFLSDFTSGVKKGLSESHKPEGGSNDDGNSNNGNGGSES